MKSVAAPRHSGEGEEAFVLWRGREAALENPRL